MKTIKWRYFMGDFETTVYENQTYTEVWAAACVELFTEDVKIFHSLTELFCYLKELNQNVCIYFHNLKFDGSFWLDFLINRLQFKQAYQILSNETWQNGVPKHVTWLKNSQMPQNSFKYSISDRGQWYTITIKTGGHFIEIRDSLKLLPFSVKRIGKSFGTVHKKLDMEYKGFRYAGCEITPEEQHYIANDVLVVKEALEIMFREGHSKLTIGGCCLEEYKNTNFVKVHEWETLFPNLYEIELDERYGSPNIGEYIKRSYRGGWCYLVKGKENKVYHNGSTFDVNSLYPSMMSSDSGNRYPIGKPKVWSGNFIPDEAIGGNMYYFVRFRTRFYIKEGHLPFIQIKNNGWYCGTENLESSDVYNQETEKYEPYYIGLDGKLKNTIVTMTMTMTDFKLFKEYYDLVDFEILDGCYFYSEIGIFDEYIDKYRKIKMESKGAIRELAKLFLNNLYGKMATNTNSSFKLAYQKEDGSLGFTIVTEHNKKPGYIAVGSAITSYARNFTIRAAQQNYHGIDKPGFIYADTDSIHCDLQPEQVKGVQIDDVQFCCWKPESQWDEAIFTRQKTYIEHITHENLKPIDGPYYNIKCAGMPDRCKDLFELSMHDDIDISEYGKEEQEFLKTRRTIEDFKEGLCVPGKLLPKRIKGGIVLKDTTYEMR